MMNVEFLKHLFFESEISISEESIGVEYCYTGSISRVGHVYRVIDKEKFFLAVIKYGIEFIEVR